jgi:hypothetical protein
MEPLPEQLKPSEALAVAWCLLVFQVDTMPITCTYRVSM